MDFMKKCAPVSC